MYIYSRSLILFFFYYSVSCLIMLTHAGCDIYQIKSACMSSAMHFQSLIFFPSFLQINTVKRIICHIDACIYSCTHPCECGTCILIETREAPKGSKSKKKKEKKRKALAWEWQEYVRHGGKVQRLHNNKLGGWRRKKKKRKKKRKKERKVGNPLAIMWWFRKRDDTWLHWTTSSSSSGS